ncbi:MULTISPECIES: MBOAT family O-acyltransferase [unclassified Bradyrhizobium]|uniref:MBOAT family O-acyltransferase n=1 Tax=unclassified Bradyrhizobium TaxID=2631580 RepID=UPI0030D4C541
MTLNSAPFLLLAAAAIVLARLLQSPFQRRLLILALNVVFLSTYLTSIGACGLLAGLLVVVYLAGLRKVRTALRWSGWSQAGVIVALWAFLFLLKDPTLLAPVNPFFRFPITVIGISYLVFRSISYLMEVELVERSGFLDYLNYMLFFPTVLAGPIERYKPFVEQYGVPLGGPGIVLPALHRIANGYIKKFVIADNLTAFSVAGVTDPANTATSVLWIAALLQLFLIWLDFSGYCDIAIGIASLMGIRIRENFNRPFSSVNIKEFWERWHISMSSLMRDYIFTPICKVILSRTRRTMHWPLITAAYCMIMILIALWHGTALGFFVFGLLHGLVLVAIQVRQHWRPRGAVQALSVVQHAAWAVLTYVFVSISLVLWMATNGRWLEYFRAMLGGA